MIAATVAVWLVVALVVGVGLWRTESAEEPVAPQDRLGVLGAVAVVSALWPVLVLAAGVLRLWDGTYATGERRGRRDVRG